MLIEVMLAESLASGGLLFGLRRSQKKAEIEQSLMEWDVEEKPTPVVDGLCDRYLNAPANPKQKKLAGHLVSTVREVVNRKAFRLAVEDAISSDSRIRSWVEKLRG